MSHVASHLIDDAHLWWDKGSRPIVFVDAQPGQNLVGTYNPSTRSAGGSHTSYQSFAALQGNIPDGSTVFVRGGTYRTARVWWQGIFANKVVVKPFNRESVIIKPLDLDYTDGNWPLFLLGGHNIRFELLEFDGEITRHPLSQELIDAALYGYHYAIGNGSTVSGAQDWEAYGLIIHDFAHAGIKGGNWKRLEANHVHDIGTTWYDHAFYCWGDNIEAWWNWLHHIAGFGVHIYGGGGNNDYAEIVGNVVHNVGTSGHDYTACYLVDGSYSKIYHNIAHASRIGIAYFGSGMDGHDLQNNIFSNISDYKIHMANAYNFGTNGVSNNNVFDGNATSYDCNNAATFRFRATPPNMIATPVFASEQLTIPADLAPGIGATQTGVAAALADNYTVGLDPTYTAWPPRIARRQNPNAGAFV